MNTERRPVSAERDGAPIAARAAGGVERTLLLLRAVVNEWAAVLMDRLAQESLGRPFSQ